MSDLSLADFTPERIRQKFSVLKWRTELYRLVFKRLRPKSLLVPNSGQFALFLAANDLGIPFVEMQHGIFSDSHPDNLPGYALDGGAADAAAARSSDGLWRLLGREAAGHCARPAWTNTPCWRTTDRLLARAAAKPLCCGSGKAGADTDIAGRPIGRSAVEFVRGPFSGSIRGRCGSMSGFTPATKRSAVHSTGISSQDDRVVLWRGNAKPDTYEMIALSDLHLSIFSACHFEALGIGTPTAILVLPGHELVLDLAARGDAILIESPRAAGGSRRATKLGRGDDADLGILLPSRQCREPAAVLAECSTMRTGGVR